MVAASRAVGWDGMDVKVSKYLILLGQLLYLLCSVLKMREIPWEEKNQTSHPCFLPLSSLLQSLMQAAAPSTSSPRDDPAPRRSPTGERATLLVVQGLFFFCLGSFYSLQV